MSNLNNPQLKYTKQNTNPYQKHLDSYLFQQQLFYIESERIKKDMKDLNQTLHTQPS